jgi:hypothetical protein
MKKCHNCGYERQFSDDRYGIIPSTECPKCRVIYKKVEKAAKIKQHEETRRESVSTIRETGVTSKSKKTTINYAIFTCAIFLLIYAGVAFFSGKKTYNVSRQPNITNRIDNKLPSSEAIVNNQPPPFDTSNFNEGTPLSVSVQSNRQADQQSITNLYKTIAPSVVLIQTDRGQGTGFFINHSGDVITNHHVVAGANQARIKTAQGQLYFVKGVLADDIINDLAMISVSISSDMVRPLSVASALPEVGEKIIVIGNPKGLEQTVSDGIVSAIRGDRLIQITAPISPGSSGGPVLNMRGEVICVVKSSVASAQNLNFCVPGEKVANLRSGANYSLSQMTPTRKVYCYAEDNGSVVITDTPQKVTSYTLISRPDGTLDKAEYEKWVLKEMKITGNPEYFDPVATAQGSVDKDKEKLFRRTFPYKSSNSGMTLEEQKFWQNNLNQQYQERYNRAVAWKNWALQRYKYMMNVFDRYNATSQ